MTENLAGRVQRLVAQHKEDRGALLPILHDLQHLAKELNLSRADVHGVVTFYRDFRDAPAGAHVRVCRGEACQAVGAEALAAHARARLGVAFGETKGNTPQGTNLDQVFCLGNCALGPSVEVNGTTYGRVDAAQLDSLIARATR